MLIGIDGYPYYPLHGCVSDAKLMERYLIDDLGVPSNRIQLLLGTSGVEVNPDLGIISPTRANIIRTLYSLIDNCNIKRGDNIVVYFAGHGARYAAREYYRSRIPPDASLASIRPMEALCPMDRTDLDATGLPIPDISDREINAIFTQISLTKGHAITLILDCCYSGTHTKSSTGVRTIPPLPRASIGPMLEGAHQALIAFPQYLGRCSVAAHDWQPDRVLMLFCRRVKNMSLREKWKKIRDIMVCSPMRLCKTLRSGRLGEGIDVYGYYTRATRNGLIRRPSLVETIKGNRSGITIETFIFSRDVTYSFPHRHVTQQILHIPNFPYY